MYIATLKKKLMGYARDVTAQEHHHHDDRIRRPCCNLHKLQAILRSCILALRVMLINFNQKVFLYVVSK